MLTGASALLPDNSLLALALQGTVALAVQWNYTALVTHLADAESGRCEELKKPPCVPEVPSRIAMRTFPTKKNST
jgi:hypothetical protein